MGSGLPGRILVLGAALAVGLGASGARGEPAKWDQKRVASIAEQLRVGINALYDNVIKLPPNNSPLQRKVRFQVLDDLRTLKQVSGSLARNLKAGRGREETFPTYQRIQTIRRDLEEHARRADIKVDTLNSAAKVADLNRQLMPYYEEEEKEVQGMSPPAEAPAPPTSAPEK